ncbi:hypothetical protein HDU81_001758 [Chytriomyces hyalinus]|nr:hypothetical protein HDU81_001758 [Chytriomyces hyalinus]
MVSLSLASSLLSAGGPLYISWSDAITSDKNDWLCITASSTPSWTNYMSGWKYTHGSESKSSNPTLSAGSVALSAPSTPGQYTVYFCRNAGYDCPASVSFQVSAMTLTASASTVVAGGFLRYAWTGADVGSKNDWITFTSSGVPSKSSYISDSWQYTYGTQIKTGVSPPATGSISVKAPSTPGVYSAYYCKDNGYDCTASVQVTVTPVKAECRAKPASSIEHVILIVSENHSFDSYFGNYCQAAPGTFPTCNEGRKCCAAITPSVGGVKPQKLDDASNKANDRDHLSTSEICEMNGGKMDKYIKAGGCKGSADYNYAAADGSPGSASKYWAWAQQYAMADNFFQAAAGQSSMNDMYFARGAYVFQDNSAVPEASDCYNFFTASKKSYQDPMIADLLNQCSVSWSFYAEDFTFDPPFLQCYPNNYDPSDNPFEYYPSVRNSPKKESFFKDFTLFQKDVQNGQLPAVSYIKALGTRSEHPLVSTISAGEDFNTAIIDSILKSDKYKQNTLIILVPDESGGFRDSVTPPPNSPIDNQPYGPRIPFVAIGYHALENYISHVQMEPASLVRFIESNFLGGAPGQLQTRDAVVNNIGSVLNVTRTGYVFP